MTMQPDDQNMKNNPDKYQIRISDLPGEIRAIAKLIGLAPALKLVVEYSGENVYFPKYDAITRVVRDKAIRDGYGGPQKANNVLSSESIQTKGIDNA